MWGYPHIPVGRRVERPIQCRKVAEASQLLAAYRLCGTAHIHKTEAGSTKLCSCLAGSFSVGAMDLRSNGLTDFLKNSPQRAIPTSAYL